MPRMKRLVVAAIAVLGLAIVPVALAVIDGTYRGRSSQGFRVAAQSTDSQVQRVNIPWRATNCTPDDDYAVRARRFVYRNDDKTPINQSGSRFGAGRRVSLKLENGGRAVVSARMSGRMTDHDKIAGTQKISVRTKDDAGEHRCTAFMRWTAKLVPPPKAP